MRTVVPVPRGDDLPFRAAIRDAEGEEFAERRRAQVSRVQRRKHRDKNQFVQESSREFARLAAGEAFCRNEAGVQEGEALTSKRESELPSPEERTSLAELC